MLKFPIVREIEEYKKHELGENVFYAFKFSCISFSAQKILPPCAVQPMGDNFSNVVNGCRDDDFVAELQHKAEVKQVEVSRLKSRQISRILRKLSYAGDAINRMIHVSVRRRDKSSSLRPEKIKYEKSEKKNSMGQNRILQIQGRRYKRRPTVDSFSYCK